MSDQDFLHCGANAVLRELADNPVDLTLPGMLSSQRIRDFSLQVDGWTFSYATERVDETTLSVLYDLARERKLLPAMQSMQAGGIVNVIAGRKGSPALHTATRAWIQEIPLSAEAEKIASQAKVECQRLQDFLEKVRSKYSTIVQIGIGGSELGPKALYEALRGCCPSDKEVYFVSNIDPDEVFGVLQRISCKDTLVVTVSKSGSTLETQVNEELFADYFAKQGLSTKDHFLAVTCAESPMDNADRYREVFHMWDSIGGRYSATSMVGGVVLGFAFGVEAFTEVLKGAAAMDRIALQEEQNLPLLAALLGIWNRNYLGYPTTAVIPYSSGLAYFPAHLQQCSMESNGKSLLKTGERVTFPTGPVVWGGVGTNSQHSFFQSLHQGTDIVPVEFIGFLQSQRGLDLSVSGCTSFQKLLANMLAQAIALAKGKKSIDLNKEFPGNRPSSLLVGPQLTPYYVGSLLAFYEHKIAFQGFCWGINSFDQEGVSLGKDLANQILDMMQGGTPSEEDSAGHLLRLFAVKNP